MFQPVDKDFDVPRLEHAVQRFWRENSIQERYLERNRSSPERFSFLDGPITANGIMGVHHAWGRTYKDLWQRYNTMLGKRQRYQNGFDCQGLWVEVTVERELGFSNKRDIESYGIAEFVRKCKESVYGFADIITRQSQRLGQFMDWDDSYFTLSDENNYTIWHFLKTCHERGLIYRGTDVMPWCTRCGTGLSEHEIATDGYQELTHTSLYVRLPLNDADDEYLLVWTTTPWTLTSNVAVAVNPDLRYLKVLQDGSFFYVAEAAAPGALRRDYDVIETLAGADLVGRSYRGPFDELPAAREVRHRVIPWQDVAADEGTGLVHIAPGCGKEDFALGKQFDLAVIAPIDQDGVYVDGFDWLSGRNVHDVTADIVTRLRDTGFLYRPQSYTHRYPTCWRCGTELVFRLVGEWFIAMDPLREGMMDVVRRIRWIPSFGLERELDWLRNMDDWMISKKRYWGLALPFWLCPSDHLTVIGSKQELEVRSISGIEGLESPHRPWVDAVRIRCSECDEIGERIPDVGNPWLDAGIVPFATMGYTGDRSHWEKWFPADFITESFPGQFRNWFYSMLAMSTVLEDRNPFSTVLGYALVRDQTGREMHKSWGNAIGFDEAADRAGADLMRWLFVQHNPSTNVNFGWESLDAIKRRLLILWNTYSFFVTYARIDGWEPGHDDGEIGDPPLLDRWLRARLNALIVEVREGLDNYDAMRPSQAIDRFIEELSTWYVRRSRRRFWKAESDADKRWAYATLYDALTSLTALIAPFMPFLAETLYQNLVVSVRPDAESSVHLTEFPTARTELIDESLLRSMSVAQDIVGLGRAARDRVNIKVRQPLAHMHVALPSDVDESVVGSLSDIVLDELNVKDLTFTRSGDEFVSYSVRPNLPALGPRYGRRLGALRGALSALDPAGVARQVEQGQTIRLEVDGEIVDLDASDVLVEAREREGFAAMASGGLLVALDTQLSPELVLEGYAREVVRRINDWRKEAGFDIQDRIDLEYDSSESVHEAIRRFCTYISDETLAATLKKVSLDSDPSVFTARFGDEWLSARLRPVS